MFLYIVYILEERERAITNHMKTECATRVTKSLTKMFIIFKHPYLLKYSSHDIVNTHKRFSWLFFVWYCENLKNLKKSRFFSESRKKSPESKKKILEKNIVGRNFDKKLPWALLMSKTYFCGLLWKSCFSFGNLVFALKTDVVEKRDAHTHIQQTDSDIQKIIKQTSTPTHMRF